MANKLDDNRINNYLSNPQLPIIKKEWKGNPVTSSNRFINHEYPFLPKLQEVIKWQRQGNPQKQEKQSDKFRLPVHESDQFLTEGKDGICWLGHATFMFRVNGKLFLTDPVFGSPSLFMKRFSKLPFSPGRLDDLDYFLISHDHRDHLDESSIKQVFRVAPHAKVFTGLRIGDLIKKWNPKANIQEAGWYQQYEIEDDVELYYLPSRHWCRRALTDTNYHLWGSFLIRTKNTTIYFGADSGYGTHFAEIGELFGKIDYAIIGIGAYKPEWFMGPSHTSPSDALQAAKDLKCKFLIPMHYGTFDLADEPLGDPLKTLQKEHKKGKFEFKLLTPAVGESVFF